MTTIAVKITKKRNVEKSNIAIAILKNKRLESVIKNIFIFGCTNIILAMHFVRPHILIYTHSNTHLWLLSYKYAFKLSKPFFNSKYFVQRITLFFSFPIERPYDSQKCLFDIKSKSSTYYFVFNVFYNL